jgi:phosphate transport system substrate-binding protein
MKRLRVLVLCLLSILIIAGCKSGGKSSESEGSVTAGHAVIPASDAAFDLAWSLSASFQGLYRGAFVDIVRMDDRSMIDSLLSERTEQIFLDRPFAHAESLAFEQARLKLYTYKVCYYPVYLLVESANPVKSLDSTKLRGLLVGTTTNWKDLGGADAPVHIYAPPPGDGAFQSLAGYFGGLDSVSAKVCSTSTRMLELAKEDEGALLIYAQPITGSRYRMLRFEREDQVLYPDAESILKPPTYPFKLTFTYATTHVKSDVASGFLTYIQGNTGQREAMNLGYRPAAVPVKIVRVKQ